MRLNGSNVNSFWSNFISGGLQAGNVPFTGSIGGTVLVQVGGPNQTLQIVAHPLGFALGPLTFYSPCELDLIKVQ